MTAHRDRQEELERIGSLHVLAKPFSIDEITELMNRLVGVGAGATG